MEDIEKIASIIISAATLWIGYLIYTKGIVEYKTANKIKRAEFLEKLIEDFRNEEMDIAKEILDDFYILNKESRGLPIILRDHKSPPGGITDEDELRIRKSFDELFDFFTKLAYYHKNNLISSEELGYFIYYINKIKVENFDVTSSDPKKEGARIYITTYFDKEEFRLFFQNIN